MSNAVPAMGWLPDIPSIKDYDEDTPQVAEMLTRTAVPALTAAVSATAHAGASGDTGRHQPRTRQRGAAAVAAPVAAIARKTDLREYFSPIEDQGQLGSCTANAGVALLEYFEQRALGRHIDASRLFLYKVTRNLLGWTGDTGAYLRTTMEALVCFGVPPERYWPYDGRTAAQNPKYEAEPPAFCYAFASNFEALTYYRLDPNGATPGDVLNNIRTHLAGGFPSIFGTPAYEELMRPAPGGQVAYPRPKSKLYGGHAIVAAGYDDDLVIGADKGALLIRNSWGTGWGDRGYGWLSYKYVTEGLAVDWWTIIRPKWVDTRMFE